MKRLKKFLGGFIAGVVLFCTACSGNDISSVENSGEKNGVNVAMGRFVEDELPLPAGVEAMQRAEETALFMQDGKLQWYGVDFSGDRTLLVHSVFEKNAWTAQEIPWLEEIRQNEMGASKIRHIVPGPDESLYICIEDDSYASQLFFWKDNQLNRLAMPHWDEKKENGANYGTVAGSVEAGSEGEQVETFRSSGYVKFLSVLDNGDFLVSFSGVDKCYRYTAKGELISSVPLSEYGGMELLTTGDALYSLGYDENLSRFNFSDQSQPPVANISLNGSMDVKLSADQENNLYVLSTKGIQRLANGGSLWETVLDGNLSILSSPSYTVKNFITDGSGGFYYSFSALTEDGEVKFSKIIHASYHSDVPTTPSEILSVYALEDSPTLRQTISVYQQEHPDTMVDLQIGYDPESSPTMSDIIRALNTELLAGKGPDVLILDGLPLHSYIEKGVLDDISDLVPEDMYANLAEAMRQEGKIYAVPGKITIPLLYGASEKLDQIQTLTDLSQDSQPPFLILNDPQKLLDVLMASSAPDWTDDRGTPDRGKLAEFFAYASDIYSKWDQKENMGSTMFSMAGAGDASIFDIGQDEVSYSSGDALFCMRNTEGFSVLRSNLTTVSMRETINDSGESEINYEIGIGSFKHMPGYPDQTFIPVGMAGVVSTGKTEAARAFVQTMLSPAVQNYAFNDGLSILKSVFHSWLDATRKDFEDMMKESLEVETQDSSAATDNMGNISNGFDVVSRQIQQILPALSVPVIIDSYLKDAVTEQGIACLTEGKTPEAAADDVLKAFSLKLQEQQ